MFTSVFMISREYPTFIVYPKIKKMSTAKRKINLIFRKKEKGEIVRKKKKEEVELYVPKGYTFEEIYDGDDEGYGYEDETPAYQEEVKLRYEREEREQRV